MIGRSQPAPISRLCLGVVQSVEKSTLNLICLSCDYCWIVGRFSSTGRGACCYGSVAPFTVLRPN